MPWVCHYGSIHILYSQGFTLCMLPSHLHVIKEEHFIAPLKYLCWFLQAILQAPLLSSHVKEPSAQHKVLISSRALKWTQLCQSKYPDTVNRKSTINKYGDYDGGFIALLLRHFGQTHICIDTTSILWNNTSICCFTVTLIHMLLHSPPNNSLLDSCLHSKPNR